MRLRVDAPQMLLAQRLVLVSAGGWGKSAVLARWITGRPACSPSVPADAGDDPLRLLECLVASRFSSCTTCSWRSAPEKTLCWRLPPAAHASPASSTRSVAVEVARRIVIDDLHCIDDPEAPLTPWLKRLASLDARAGDSGTTAALARAPQGFASELNELVSPTSLR